MGRPQLRAITTQHAIFLAIARGACVSAKS